MKWKLRRNLLPPRPQPALRGKEGRGGRGGSSGCGCGGSRACGPSGLRAGRRHPTPPSCQPPPPAARAPPGAGRREGHRGRRLLGWIPARARGSQHPGPMPAPPRNTGPLPLHTRRADTREPGQAHRPQDGAGEGLHTHLHTLAQAMPALPRSHRLAEHTWDIHPLLVQHGSHWVTQTRGQKCTQSSLGVS